MIELIVQSGKHQGKRLRLPDQGEVLIGRDEGCQIRLASSEVSRHHCVLKPTPEGILARDLDSRNGTYLNETLMEDETLLKPGDILRIGPIMLQVPGAPEATVRASDNDIAEWLSQEGLSGSSDSGESAPGDTTIIPKPAALDTPIPASPPRESSPRQYRSVAEEAADIIRRHHEAVKAQREQG
ncbi:MAG TPA: FHA domain-containing protein [Planctomycetaceae bacterium]|nr:FHA domain-containing protein [Planctomycetaceae bacterium]